MGPFPAAIIGKTGVEAVSRPRGVYRLDASCLLESKFAIPKQPCAFRAKFKCNPFQAHSLKGPQHLAGLDFPSDCRSLAFVGKEYVNQSERSACSRIRKPFGVPPHIQG